KRKRIAIETLEIYAPLANRLGMWRIKGMLEDGSFPYAYPEAYKKVVALRKTKGRETIKRLEKIYRTLGRELAERGHKDFQIDYRVKYLYSLYKKLLDHNMDIERIYDISALRLIVTTEEECYQALGVVHSLWRPVPGRLRDYISSPKPNGYKSIHTAIFTSDGSVAEIQIRTKAMQEEAEYGNAAHLAYAESGKPAEGGKLPRSLKWIQELIEWQKHVHEHEEFLTGLKTDFFQDRIFVFTPKGEVIELPAGATPIDFAYSIHSDIGNHTSGAKVNGKFVALHTPLEQGDIIEIETKKASKPSHKWLEYAKTAGARKHIRMSLQKDLKK
ncbi:MAG TPA: TGS domain-containing protein, partial [Candidatus Paceibacterota bacterium]|nr:TGS domain-containing protein [Candidatus Paceibacterota bacterium]